MTTTQRRLAPSFIEGKAGPLHVMSFLPECEKVQGVVVVAQALAEEANKSRRMVALLGRALQARGWATVVPDMYGTGDSGGDFADADWQLWVDDFRRIVALQVERFRVQPTLLGVRQGALVVAEALAESDLTEHVVFWQPVTAGGQALTQFLRLRMAAALGAERRETVADLRGTLRHGEDVEVAGYRLSPRLAEGLDKAVLAPPVSVGALDCFAVASQPRDSLPPGLQTAVDAWHARGWSVNGHFVTGDAFWATQEISTVPELVVRTADVVMST
jgi:exosortase A-associated hydrolase 2